jgi:hypothetical protein
MRTLSADPRGSGRQLPPGASMPRGSNRSSHARASLAGLVDLEISPSSVVPPGCRSLCGGAHQVQNLLDTPRERNGFIRMGTSRSGRDVRGRLGAVHEQRAPGEAPSVGVGVSSGYRTGGPRSPEAPVTVIAIRRGALRIAPGTRRHRFLNLTYSTIRAWAARGAARRLPLARDRVRRRPTDGLL